MIKKIAISLASVFALLTLIVVNGLFQNKEVELISSSSSIHHDSDILSLIDNENSSLPNRIFGDKSNNYQLSMNVKAFGQQVESEKDVTEQPILKMAVTGTLLLQAQDLVNENVNTRVFVKLTELDVDLGQDDNSGQHFDEEWSGLEALKIPFAFDLDDQGGITSIHLSKHDEEVSAGIKRVIASRMQFVTDDSDKSNWQIEESDETGVHIAEYSKESNAKYSKSVLRYIELAQVENTKAMHSIRDHQGKSSYQFESTGLLYSIDSLNDVSTSMQGLNIRSSTRYNIEWVGFSDQQLIFDLTSDYRSLSPNVIARFNTQNFYPGQNSTPINLYDFVAQLSAIDPEQDLEERWKLRDQLIQSIENDPSILADVSSMIASNLNERDVIFLLGAITDAGTSESQQALIDISSNSDLPLDVRQQAISHIGFVDAPTQEVVEYLSTIGNDHSLAPELREPALLALGNSVRSGFQEENITDFSANPAVYEDAVKELEEGFKNATEFGESHTYIAALGNAGSKSSSNLLLELADSDNEIERKMAVDSLRFIDDPRVDSTLIDLMQKDSSASVQIDAIKTSVYRNENPKMNESLFSIVKESNNPQVRIAALESLGFRLPDSDALMQEMVYRSMYDEHEMVREFAQSVVDAHNNASTENSN